MAQNYAAIILERQQDEREGSSRDYREMDINSLEMSRPRSIGCEHVTLEALRLLGLDSKLKELGFTGPGWFGDRHYSRACLSSCK